jgi:hypothetical protein
MSTEHSMDPDSKSPEEVERDVRQSRVEVEETLDAIQGRLWSREWFEQAVDDLKSAGGADFWHYLGATMRENPIPVALVGTGLAWLMLSGSWQKRQRHYDDVDLLEEDAESHDGGARTARKEEQGTPSGAERAGYAAAREAEKTSREGLIEMMGEHRGERIAKARAAARIAYEAALYEAALEEGYRQGLASDGTVAAGEPDMIDIFRSAQIDEPPLKRPKPQQPRARFSI